MVSGRVVMIAPLDRRSHLLDVAAGLRHPSLGTHSRICGEVQLQLGVREHDRSDVAALQDSAPTFACPLTLASNQLRADRAVGGDGTDRRGDGGAANLGGGIVAVDENAGVADGEVDLAGESSYR